MEDLISVFRWNIHITDAVRYANEFTGCGNDAEYTFIQSRFVTLSGRGSLKDNVVDNDDDDGDSDIGEGGGTHPSQGLIEPALADADCLHDVLDDTEALGDDLVMPSEDPAAVAEDLEDDNELGIVDDLHDDLMVFDLPYG